MNVRQELAKLLESKTGYQLGNKPMGDRCIFASAVDNLFFFSFISLPRLVDINSLANNIVADSNMGQVKYGEGTTLAIARGEEEICKSKIIAALKELRETKTMGTLISTYETHRGSTGKASKTVEEICMMGLVPGQCRIFRRLGM